MHFPQFLVGMFTTSAVVAIWADIETGSVGKALAWTFLTLMILQIGYFLLAFWLFYKRSTKSTDAKPGRGDHAEGDAVVAGTELIRRRFS